MYFNCIIKLKNLISFPIYFLADFPLRCSTVYNIYKNNTRIDDDSIKDINMEEMLNSIISEMKPLFNSNLFNSEIILNTKLKNITLQTKKQLENGFIKIFYKNENINIKDIINHKSYFYHVKNSIFTAGKFLSFGYII